MTILGNFDFFSLCGNMGGAYGGVPSPIEADQEKIRLGSLDFWNLHAFKFLWSKFHAFITICTIFVLVAWTKYKGNTVVTLLNHCRWLLYHWNFTAEIMWETRLAYSLIG